MKDHGRRTHIILPALLLLLSIWCASQGTWRAVAPGKFAAVLYLLLTRNGRGRLREAGPWITGVLLLLGFTPTLLHNLRGEFASMDYYLSGRHGSAASSRKVM